MSIIHSTSIFCQIITLEGDEIAVSFMKTFLTPLQMLDVYAAPLANGKAVDNDN